MIRKGAVYENAVDTIKETGVYTMVWTSRDLYGTLVVFNSGEFIIQLYGYARGIMYRRFIFQDNMWNQWYELANN